MTSDGRFGVGCMKYCLTALLFTALSVSSCEQCTQRPPGSHTIEDRPFDTIVLDYAQRAAMEQARSQNYANMPPPIRMDSLKRLAMHPFPANLRSAKELFPKPIDLYYTNDLPNWLYRQWFPQEEVRTIARIREAEVDSSARTVTLHVGSDTLRAREFRRIYAMRDFDQYVAILLTKVGKYSPDLELITTTKDKLRVVDRLPVRGGIRDSYDVDLFYTDFDLRNNRIEVKQIKNLAFTDFKLDTTYVRYRILVDGKLVVIRVVHLPWRRI